MSRNICLVILVIGLMILLCALLALAYAYWPVEVLHDQTPIAPTWFAPP